MPACHGEDPQLFEFDLFYPQALKICATCPVRDWCLREVDPIRHNYFEGVSGGYAWKNGYPNAKHFDPDDHVLVAYLSTRRRKLN